MRQPYCAVLSIGDGKRHRYRRDMQDNRAKPPQEAMEAMEAINAIGAGPTAVPKLQRIDLLELLPPGKTADLCSDNGRSWLHGRGLVAQWVLSRLRQQIVALTPDD